MNRRFVRELLVEESFAYGFTIAFWGGGLLLVKEYGLLGVGGLLGYAGGAVTGFGLLAVATFDAAVEPVDAADGPEYHVLAAIHYLSALVPILAVHGLVVAPVGRLATVFVAGLLVSTLYNAFVTVEELLSEAIRRVKGRYGPLTRG